MESNLSLSSHDSVLAIAVHAWLSGAKDEKDLTARMQKIIEKDEPLRTFDALSRRLAQKVWEM